MFNVEDSNELKSMYKGIDELTELFHKTDSRVIKSTLMDAIHTFIVRMTNIKAEMGRNIDQLNEYAHSKLVSMMDDVYTKARTVDKTDKNIKSDEDGKDDSKHIDDKKDKESVSAANMEKLKSIRDAALRVTDEHIKPDEDGKDDSKHTDDKKDKESASTSTDDFDATMEKFESMMDDAYNMLINLSDAAENIEKDDSKHTDDKKDKESVSTTNMEKLVSIMDGAYNMLLNLRTLNWNYGDSKDDSKHTDDKKVGKFDKSVEDIIRSLEKSIGSNIIDKKNDDKKSDH